jgi:hypothetical protein
LGDFGNSAQSVYVLILSCNAQTTEHFRVKGLENSASSGGNLCCRGAKFCLRMGRQCLLLFIMNIEDYVAKR